jgi:myo-inositol 2-dehydrogenase / D-chiro-inositol 1-dehydrogenase
MGHKTLADNTPTTGENPSNTRRNFLKNSSALIAGSSIAAATLPIARSAYAAGDDTIKLGLVGCGGRGSGAATQALAADENTKLVAMGDAFENRLSSAKRGIASRYKDRVDVEGREFVGVDAYKRVIESDCDMVLLATPPGFRPLHFETAIKAGKHVFMEKPVASDAPGVRRVLEANKLAREKNLAVAVGLQRHHQTGYREIIRKLQDGAIGDIILARAYWNSDGVWVRNREKEQTELEYQMNNWYYFNWLSGDHIVEQHIHNLDVINWLMNSHPVEAQGQGGREVRKGNDTGQIYDHHMIEFTYPNGTKMLSQCRHIPNTWGSVEEFAHGSKGWADISGGKIYDTSNKVVWSAPESENGWEHEHVELFKAIRNGEIPNEGDYGAESTMTAIMGRMATYSGKKLSWDDCINSKLALADFDSLNSFNDKAPLEPDDKGNYYVPVPGQSTEKVL